MKRTIKAFTLICAFLLALALTLSACNGATETQSPADATGATTNSGATEDKPGEEPGEHTHSFGEWTVVTKATCTATGLEERVCACGEKEEREIAATGHTEVTDAAVAPTCTETGLTEGKHCSVCDTVLVAQETVAALGHSFGEWTVVTEATCTATGLEERVCACSEKEEREIAATGHTEVTDAAVAPTCTETGLTEGKHCSVCDTVLVAQETVAALGHSFGEWTVVTEATCTAAGIEERVCSCGEKETQSIDALPHSFSEWMTIVKPKCEELGLSQRYCSVCKYTESKSIEATGHTVVVTPAVAPSCTKSGLTEGKYCSVCKAVLVAQEVIKENGHSFVDGLCHCGTSDGSDLSYELSEDGKSYTVAGIGTCKAKNVVIPSSYKGLPVTSIGKRAFRDCTNLTSITLPDGVTSIGEWAFQDCSSLTSITIPDGVKFISTGAFRGCSSLTSINIPDGVRAIYEAVFSHCYSLTSITIPDGVRLIGRQAFFYCGLTSITFDGTMEQWEAIKKDSFWNANTGGYVIHCTDGDIRK